MTQDELLAIEGDTPPPVMLKDGRMGLLVIYPNKYKAEAGVQVPGEDYHRWIPPANLRDSGGVLIEAADGDNESA